MYKKLSYFVATMFGTGYSPKAPGTAGSLATIPLAFVIAYNFGSMGLLISSLVVFFVGTIFVKEVLKYTKHDPSFIVIDETAGQLLSFLLVGDRLMGNCSGQAIIMYILGFALFRFFDITKPQPVGWADKKINNAWGVMLDDMFAGIYATLILYFIVIYVWF